MEKSLSIFTDGGSRGNPGPAGIGVIIKDVHGKILAKIAEKIGRETNNVAEYKAVIAGLRWLKKNAAAITKVSFFLDSTLVASQLTGKFKIKNAGLKKLALEAKTLEKSLGGQIFYHAIPREKNHEADLLVNQALDN